MRLLSGEGITARKRSACSRIPTNSQAATARSSSVMSRVDVVGGRVDINHQVTFRLNLIAVVESSTDQCSGAIVS